VFFPEFMIKHIKTETNRYVKSVADKVRRKGGLISESLMAYGGSGLD
jgi:hypothetical protein